MVVVNHYLQDDDIGEILGYLGGSPRYFLKHVVFVNIILLAGHAYELLKMIVCSVYHRCLLFSAPVKCSARIQEAPSSRMGPMSSALEVSTLHSSISYFTATFARKGSFGIEGTHYGIAYTLVEVVSVTVRVFQAYRISTWIPRLWINRLFALLASLSCFSIPALKLWVLPAQQLKNRVALLVADSSFDFVTSMLMPTAIAIPYVLEYDPVLVDFPLLNYYRDTWFVQAVSENQLAFAVSWLDFLAKNYPKFSYFFAMTLIKTCISEQSCKARNGQRQFKRSLFRKQRAAVAPTSAMVTLASSLRRLPSVAELTTFVRESWHRRAVTKNYWLRNGFFILSGLFVLVIHIIAIARTWGGDAENASACLLKMHPWFGSSSYHCAVVEIRCMHQSISRYGDADELNAFLRFLHPETVKGLIFSSCSNLQMPPVIAQFTNLQLIKIFNSTIASWDGDATLTKTNHPYIQLVYVVDSNMTEVPRGLLAKDDFPPTLSDIEFCGTNLTKLPSEVGVTWSPLYFFVLERSPGITEFPAPLANLQLSYVSLQSNSIAYIPDDLLANQTLWMLGLSNNPLERLPEQIGDTSKLLQVFMRSTLVMELPAWMSSSSLKEATYVVTPQSTVEVEAGGSRLCAEVDPSMLVSVVNPLFALSCVEDDSPSANYYYPLDQEIQWRQHE